MPDPRALPYMDRLALARQPGTDLPTLIALGERAEPGLVRAILERLQRLHPHLIRQLFRGELREEHLDDLRRPDRAPLPPDLEEYLARHASARLRTLVAAHPTTSPHWRARLSEDADPTVQQAAGGAGTRLAKPPTTSAPPPLRM